MNELDAYNMMLATLGELPLESIDVDHGTLPAAVQQLKNTRRSVLGKGWWFNREVVTLTPDPDTGRITVPTDTLSIIPTDQSLMLAQRGSQLYDPVNATYDIGEPVSVDVVTDLAFDDLPENAKTYIAAKAVEQFNKDNEGDPTKLREAQRTVAEAYFVLSSEDIRQSRVNFLKRPSTAVRLNRIVGTSGRVYSR